MSRNCKDCVHEDVCMWKDTKGHLDDVVSKTPNVFRMLPAICLKYRPYEVMNAPKVEDKEDDDLAKYRHTYPETPGTIKEYPHPTQTQMPRPMGTFF